MVANSLFLLGLLTVVDAKFNCATPGDFQSANPALLTKAFKDEVPKPDYFLHNFLYDKGTYLGNGAFGEVRAAAGVIPKVVMKRTFAKSIVEEKNLNTELTFLKQLCGFQTETVENKLLECNSDVIAGFRGCVENGDEVFIFQEPMTRDLKSDRAQIMYKALDGKQKAQVMVNLIRKYQKIHDKKIVHNDIKPANIMMKTNDFSDLRVVDFGLALDVGTKSRNGTPWYFAPERHKKPEATYASDVYSLALTFMTMEEEGMAGLRIMNENCFKNPFDDTCKKKLKDALEKAFSVKNKTDFLLGVFNVAADPDSTKRYKSMKEFADAVEKAIQSKGGVARQFDIQPQDTYSSDKKANTESQETGDSIQNAEEKPLPVQVVEKKPRVANNNRGKYGGLTLPTNVKAIKNLPMGDKDKNKFIIQERPAIEFLKSESDILRYNRRVITPI